MVESDPFMRTQVLPFGLIPWPDYPSSLFALAVPYSSSSRKTKCGLFSEATAEDRANAAQLYWQMWTCLCTIQDKDVPRGLPALNGKGQWCCEAGKKMEADGNGQGGVSWRQWPSPIGIELRWRSHTSAENTSKISSLSLHTLLQRTVTNHQLSNSSLSFCLVRLWQASFCFLLSSYKAL